VQEVYFIDEFAKFYSVDDWNCGVFLYTVFDTVNRNSSGFSSPVF
jgi:hypothetical protein